MTSAPAPAVTAAAGSTPLRRLRHRPGAIVAAAYLGVLVVVAVLAGVIAPFDPRTQDVMASTLGPSSEHWLGTDSYGRDLFSRLIFGARASLGVAGAVVLIALVVAVPVGLFSGYRGGRIDRFVMRFVDAGLSVPPIIVALAIAGALGPGLRNTILALVLVYLPTLIRLTRAEAMSRAGETFISASVSAGTPVVRLLRRRLLPNIASPLFIACSFWLGSALLAEASLSYLGVGVQPPTASWGGMLREAYDNSLFTSPWQLVVPGAAIAITVLAFNVLGEGLRDAFGAAHVSRGRRGRLGLTTVRRPRATGAAVPGATPAGAAPLLEIRGLDIDIAVDGSPMRVVDGLDLTIEAGEVVGLVGESGSGKSVTALSVMRLLRTPPASIAGGSIRLRGQELLDAGSSEMRRIRGRRIAMVFQDPMTSLDPSFTIGSQLVQAIRQGQRMPKDAARRRAVELLQQVHIPSAEQRMRDYPHQLSGGMRQRVALAIALASNPDLLIADEPTTALDATIQAQILELLRELRDRLGMAILFVTHDLGVVADLCDRVAVMYAGQIVEINDVDSIFERPQHPYTAGLLSAMPALETADREYLQVIPGGVPTIANFPSGCRFNPRCPHRQDECTTDGAITVRVIADAFVRCRRVDELALDGVDDIDGVSSPPPADQLEAVAR